MIATSATSSQNCKKRKEKKPCSIDALYLRPYQFCSNVHSFEEMGA
jgi:hypothetical protein